MLRYQRSQQVDPENSVPILGVTPQRNEQVSNDDNGCLVLVHEM